MTTLTLWLAIIGGVAILLAANVLDDNWRMSSGQIPFARPSWWPR